MRATCGARCSPCHHGIGISAGDSAPRSSGLIVGEGSDVKTPPWHGSGEGAVEWASGPDDTYARWADDSWPPVVIRRVRPGGRDLELADPATTVTKLSSACSGGTTDRAYRRAPGIDQPIECAMRTMDRYFYPPDAQIDGCGTLGRYRRVQPDDLDALMASAGGNDAGLGPLAARASCTKLLASPHCYTGPRPEAASWIPLGLRVDLDLPEMPARDDRCAAREWTRR